MLICRKDNRLLIHRTIIDTRIVSAHIAKNHNGMYPRRNHIETRNYIIALGRFIGVTLRQLAKRSIQASYQIADKFGEIPEGHYFNCCPYRDLTIVVDIIMLDEDFVRTVNLRAKRSKIFPVNGLILENRRIQINKRISESKKSFAETRS